MLIDLFLNSPLVALAWIVVILFALTFHEFSHAITAHLLGDATAEQHGRLTLNPFAHIDWMGVLPLVIFGFGWAKPVPYNPYYFKKPRWDSLKVSLAGPGSNLLLALLSGAGYRILSAIEGDFGLLPLLLILSVLINLLLFFFNLIPIYPLDGSKILDALFVKPQQQLWLHRLKVYGPRILLILVVISILTNINTFFFISIPAQIACYGITGDVCFSVLAESL